MNIIFFISVDSFYWYLYYNLLYFIINYNIFHKKLKKDVGFYKVIYQFKSADSLMVKHHNVFSYV